MNIKTVPPYPVFFHRCRARIPDLSEKAREIPSQLYRDLTKTSAHITGPISFFYYGMDGNPDTEFELEIAIPVDRAAAYEGEFAFRQVEAFKCVSATHRGSWALLGQCYEQLVAETIRGGHQLLFESREIYHNIASAEAEQRKRFDSPENVTEIQMKIR